MGLMRVAMDAAGGVLADQWKEYFTCDALPDDILMMRGEKQMSGRSSNRKGSDNVITKGSAVAVAHGQCMIITAQGQVAEVCAEPGVFIYDSSAEPSVFAGSLGESILETFRQIGRRFTFGGEIPNDQRVYYVNTREIVGNKYGTPNPMPIKLSDADLGIKYIMKVRCFGEYSYKITNPLLFFKSLAGNVEDIYPKSKLESQMRSELLTYLGPAFAEISRMGVPYDQLISHTLDIRDILSKNLSQEWGDGRGIEIVKFGVSSLKGDEKTEDRLTNAQFYKNDPSMLAAELGASQAEAITLAARNEGAGAAMGFMGMNMAGQSSGNSVMDLYQQAAQRNQQAAAAAPAAPNPNAWDCSCGQRGNTGKFCSGCGKPKPVPVAADSWTCSCGATVSGNFCPQCGTKRPAPAAGWTCPSCGKLNKGKFCSECGTKKPAGVPQYRCDKCGWEPEDPNHPPKFCPECGDPFDDGDIR